jgi:hypothetical protein
MALATALRTGLGAAGGLLVAIALMVSAYAVPELTDWNIHLQEVPPLHASWDPRVGPGTVPAVLIALLGSLFAARWAERLAWRWLLVATFVVGLAWSLSLAYVDGQDGIGLLLDHGNEYLNTARATTDIRGTLQEYVDRIPLASDRNWPVHLAGHPPGALLFFVLLVKLGLGSAFAAGLVVTAVAATTSIAVLITLRLLGAEEHARNVAPFLALGPAAIWHAVSADAMFAAVVAWGICALALAAVHGSRSWAVVAGLVLGYGVFLSYGLPLVGLLALGVLYLAGNWKPLPWAVGAALLVALTFAALGFNWVEAYPVLRDRYYDGVASQRPTAYFIWGNIAALLFASGPIVAAGLTQVGRTARVVSVLGLAGWTMVLLADISLMSKAEVERIWLPFVPWLLLPAALLSPSWRRFGLALQVTLALGIQHLLFTLW